MTLRRATARLTALEELNFLVTNRIPRRLATRFVGWLSRIERPVVARTSIALWRLFADLDFADTETRHFASLHACFTRRLRPGARRFDPRAGIVASPCDAIVGACGTVAGDRAHQIKGAPYRASELLGDAGLADELEGARYVTLRLTSAMYHRFHAPADLVVTHLRYLSGDCWNVNTPALRRVERLFCRNERAVIRCRLGDGSTLVLVAVAAILVASIRLRFVDTPALLRAGGSRDIPVDAAFAKGEEMGWFEHGSTIIVIATSGETIARTGERLNAGAPLLELARSSAAGGAVPVDRHDQAGQSCSAISANPRSTGFRGHRHDDDYGGR